jgi:hypothetical protein
LTTRFGKKELGDIDKSPENDGVSAIAANPDKHRK